jgi:amidohydrolase
MSLREQIEEVYPFVVQMRRNFHRWPEPSFEEFKTTASIAEELDKMGIPYRKAEPTGLMADIIGGKPGKTVMLRADIDALSITEKTDVPFQSERDGLMHACGHDAHASMLLGAARILNDNKAGLAGRVRLLFQPAEETATGAKRMIAQGALEGVDAGFGIHVFSMIPSGAICVKAGPVMPAAGIFKIKISGSVSHGAMPEEGRDATVCASALVMNIQAIVSRETAALTPLVVTVGQLHSGTRFNIVSGEAYLDGTVRYFDPELQDKISAAIRRFAKKTAEAYRCEAEVQYDKFAEILTCDPKLTALAEKAALKVTGSGKMVAPMKPVMGSEDFSEYTRLVPCTFAALGVGGRYPQHSDRYTIDEEALKNGVGMYVQFASDFLSL